MEDNICNAEWQIKNNIHQPKCSKCGGKREHYIAEHCDKCHAEILREIANMYIQDHPFDVTNLMTMQYVHFADFDLDITI